jgi:hypothetical protein
MQPEQLSAGFIKVLGKISTFLQKYFRVSAMRVYEKPCGSGINAGLENACRGIHLNFWNDLIRGCVTSKIFMPYLGYL